ncbi:MAG TPA: Asd/ArgC dimerization domain-containing protein [Candidatus Acidoferrales bacterium]|nr:Asd/ArgC dimerization domain-containing protein [Candidatus Acidoferrales bacterium]
MSAASDIRPRVAIVGASSLLGKELKQVLEDRNFPASDVILLDEGVMAGTLTEAAGEPTFIRSLEEDSFEGAQFVFFAGGASEAARNWPAALRAGASVIDLTGAAGSDPQAQRLIPALHSVLPPPPAKGANGSPRARVYVSPAVPVLIACTLSAALHSFSPVRIVLVLMAPVSERDQPGIEELESQTAGLLSFREISKTVFDAQVAFNMLSAFGSESKPRLSDVRAAVERETAAFLAGRTEVPAIQLLHAPVFYGYAFAAYAEFGSTVAIGELISALTKLGVKIGAADDPLPSNVGVAGENEIRLAPIENDANVANAVWLWGAADNLRVASVNAVRIAEDLLRES